MKQLKCLKEKMQSSIDFQLFFNCFRQLHCIFISVVIYVQSALEKKDFHFNVGKQKFSMVLLDPSLITETPLIIKHVLFQRI